MIKMSSVHMSICWKKWEYMLSSRENEELITNWSFSVIHQNQNVLLGCLKEFEVLHCKFLIVVFAWCFSDFENKLLQNIYFHFKNWYSVLGRREGRTGRKGGGEERAFPIDWKFCSYCQHLNWAQSQLYTTCLQL